MSGTEEIEFPVGPFNDFSMKNNAQQTQFDYNLIQDCVHCGLCLPKCPSYVILGNEMDSPRGRIFLAKLVADKRQDVRPAFKKHFDLCLACRCCESACPSGVRYHEIFDTAQQLIRETIPKPVFSRIMSTIALRVIFPNPKLLNFCIMMLWLYQKSGFRKIIQASRLLKVFSKKLALSESFLPPIKGIKKLRVSANGNTAPYAEPGRKTGLLRGCVMDYFEPETNRATVRVLEKCGRTVAIPEEIHCCGAVHQHNGENRLAMDCAKMTIDSFEKNNVDTVITNAAGCGAMMKEYGSLLADDPGYAEKAAGFSKKVQDITEFVSSEADNLVFNPVSGTVVYDDPCHLQHGQKVTRPPRMLLNKIPGLEVKVHRESDLCCGAAGTFNISQPELSLEVLKRKMDAIKQSGAETVITANIGCMLQLKRGAALPGNDVEVKHIVDILDASLSGSATL